VAKFVLDFGVELDLLTRDELHAELGAYEARQLSAARGVDHVRLPVMVGTPSAGALILGSTGDADQQYAGPPEGYCWLVTRISVYGLAAADTVDVFRGDPGGRRFVGPLTGTDPVWDASRSLLLDPGDHITISGTGLTATGQVFVSGEAISAPAEMKFKLIGGR
jgi:hypothetical protein